MSDYTEPVQELLRLGMPDMRRWDDYTQRGVGPEHVAELIRLATDPVGFQGDPESSEVWGPIHAWRALSQLRAVEAVPALLGLLKRVDEEEDDWLSEEMPEILARMGPDVLPAIVAFFADPGVGLYGRWGAAEAVKRVAGKVPECRDECVGILTRELERASEQDSDAELNGALISTLLDLKAVEAFPVMDRAFAADMVETMMCGDREQVRYELGLRPDRPPSRLHPELARWRLPEADTGSTPARRAQQRKRVRKKQARQAKKRNRRK